MTAHGARIGRRFWLRGHPEVQGRRLEGECMITMHRGVDPRPGGTERGTGREESTCRDVRDGVR